MMAFSAGAASLKHIAQEAGDISGVAHADAEALFGGVHGLEDGGSLVVLLEVAGGAIVQMQRLTLIKINITAQNGKTASRCHL